MNPHLTSSGSIRPQVAALTAWKHRPCAAFSLIELLVVIAVVGMLAYFAVPAFNAIGRARGVSDAAESIAAALELARTEAIARRTYAWVGFLERTEPGSRGLQVGVICSSDGTTNTAATNLRPLARAVLLESVVLVDSGAAGDPVELASWTGGLAFKAGNVNFDAGKSFTFTPEGEVTALPAPATADGFDPLLAVGLAELKGNTPDTANRAAVIIDGATGIPRVIRQ
jgi:prepilin-type N-terminal cleavage/methylation domain-containing protein